VAAGVDVYALVGPAGTGKSHRALLVANQLEITMIIDDGLLIKDGQIVAGSSAKREETRAAAVRRAMFIDPQQAVAARRALADHRPARVLVLGTSRHMIEGIVDTLDLPRPEKFIDISEVARPEEIRRAVWTRRRRGIHVIPAPTFEVKKTFSGFVINPLRLRLWRHGASGASRDMVVEKSVVRPTYSSYGRFYIADRVVSAIATRAALEVGGVARVTLAAVQGGPDGVKLDLNVVLNYGGCLPRVLEGVQARVKELVERMTALNVLTVNVVATGLSLE